MFKILFNLKIIIRTSTWTFLDSFRIRCMWWKTSLRYHLTSSNFKIYRFAFNLSIDKKRSVQWIIIILAQSFMLYTVSKSRSSGRIENLQLPTHPYSHLDKGGLQEGRNLVLRAGGCCTVLSLLLNLTRAMIVLCQRWVVKSTGLCNDDLKTSSNLWDNYGVDAGTWEINLIQIINLVFYSRMSFLVW